MEFSGGNPADKRVINCSWLRNMVRLDQHEGIDYGRNERGNRGSRRDAVRREPGVQGVCERTYLESGESDLSFILLLLQPP